MANKGINTLVGLFVGIGSILMFVVIILIGQENSIFDSTTSLYITFNDVGGLRVGSQVRLAGVSIGSVTGINFPSELEDKKLHVEIKVRTSMLPRIRKDSVATISTKGLLGDKVIEIGIGTASEAQMMEGDYLDSEEPPDMFQILEKGQELISHGAEVAKGLEIAIKKYSDDELVNHIKGIAESVDNLINEVESGDGVMHGLIYDKQVNRDVAVIVRNIRAASVNVDKTVAHIENIMNEVRTGKGTLHGLIYDEDGKQIVSSLKNAAQNIASLVEEIKSGQGMLHTLIYTEDSGNIISNLEKASRDIQKIVAYIEAGHGTIGSLIKDPSVFEDLKLILGNIKRNSALKTVIRMSLEKDDPQLTQPPPDPEAPETESPPVDGGGE
jgi:phospholipid/cholesterol/gamma-HCH transport system substrate-binding protein